MSEAFVRRVDEVRDIDHSASPPEVVSALI